MAGQPCERHAGSPPATVAVPDASAGEDTPRQRRAKAAELEARLLKSLDELYAAALARLADDLGHGEEASLEAVLHSGHCYCKLVDPVSNIVANARAYLSNPGYCAGGFADLRRLVEYSLAGLVCLVQSSRPTLTCAEAVQCLLSSDVRTDEAIDIASGLHLTGERSPASVLPPWPRLDGERSPASVPAVAETARRG